MDCRLDGRVALITGGSAGLGRAMGATFAAAGARVALLARREERLAATVAEIARETEAEVRGYAADVCDAGQVEAAFAGLLRDFGRVEVLVNNAGVARTAAFLEISDADWQADLDLKLFAAIRLCRLALPGMQERRWGRIINVLNTPAKAPRAGSAPTSVTRAAGLALTKVLSKEGAAHNVLVNGLCTGFIESEQWVRRNAEVAPEQGHREFLAAMAAELRLPLGRLGTAQEFANVACFLASDAGSYISGAAINVDGGLCAVV